MSGSTPTDTTPERARFKERQRPLLDALSTTSLVLLEHMVSAKRDKLSKDVRDLERMIAEGARKQQMDNLLAQRLRIQLTCILNNMYGEGTL